MPCNAIAVVYTNGLIVEPTARAQRRSVLDHGVAAPEFRAAIENFLKMLARMEASLQKSEWLAGPDLSLADGAVLPYVLRLEHLGLYDLMRSHPAVSAWFSRMMQRPSFEDSIGRWIPEGSIGLLQQEALNEQEAIRKLLNGIESDREHAL